MRTFRHQTEPPGQVGSAAGIAHEYFCHTLSQASRLADTEIIGSTRGSKCPYVRTEAIFSEERQCPIPKD